MHDVVDQALRADAALPAPLLEHLFDQAEATGNRRQLQTLAERDDLPYPLRRRVTVDRSATAVAASVRSGTLSDTQLDHLLADEARVAVLLAVAKRKELTAGHLQALAAAGHPAVAHALTARTDVDLSDPGLATQLSATLLDGLAARRRRPSPTDMVTALAGRLAAATIRHDHVPLRVLAQMRPQHLDVTDQRRWIEMAETEVAARMAAGNRMSDVLELCKRLADTLRYSDVPGTVTLADRLVQTHGPDGTGMRLLEDELARRRLLGDDPVATGAAATGELLERLWRHAEVGGVRRYRTGCFDLIKGLARNPRVTGERLDAVAEVLQGAGLTDAMLACDRAGLHDHAAALSAHLEPGRRLSLLRSVELVLSDTVVDRMVGDALSILGSAAGPTDACETLLAAAERGRVGQVPAALVEVSMRRRDLAPRVAHQLVTWLHARLDVARWPTFQALGDTFAGTLDELVAACDALEPTT